MSHNEGWDRRTLLRSTAVLAGAAATGPLLGAAAPAHAGRVDADALFKAGKFEQAGRAYEKILKIDPTNLHAARRRGFVALLANKFPDAEKYLKMALDLAPDDRDAHELLADCYIRQDKLPLSVPHWQAIGEDAYATWFAAVRGEPYQIVGDTGRLTWLQMDPFPLVEASINGGPAKRLTFYTGAPSMQLSSKVAKEAGLTAVAQQRIDFEGSVVIGYYGVLESLKLGGIELRNIPVGWSEYESGEDAADGNDGMLTTWVFYHFLTTFDYPGRSLILRRRTPETAAKARADAKRAGTEPLPLWMVADHYLQSRGSIAGDIGCSPQVVGVNFGGQSGEAVGGLNGDTAERLRVRVDLDRPIETFGHSTATVVAPCYPKEIRLGDAVAKDVYCFSDPSMPVSRYGYDAPAHLSHCFFKPYNITLDFTDMNLYIARGKAT